MLVLMQLGAEHDCQVRAQLDEIYPNHMKVKCLPRPMWFQWVAESPEPRPRAMTGPDCMAESQQALSLIAGHMIRSCSVSARITVLLHIYGQNS